MFPYCATFISCNNPLKTWALFYPLSRQPNVQVIQVFGFWKLWIVLVYIKFLFILIICFSLFFFSQLPISFQGVIDYIFYSKTHMNVLGVLGPLDPQWLVENNITGCPHPHIPSDHFSLLTQLELHPPLLPLVNGVHLPNRR